MLTAITRSISDDLADCQLTHIKRMPIDIEIARQEHRKYRERLSNQGVAVINLPPLPEHPDSVFVEDTAVVLDEIAIIARPGADSRRVETKYIHPILSEYRTIEEITQPATLDGGDVLRVDRTLYAGLSARTDREGVAQLRNIAGPLGYEVIEVETDGCLHLKTACTYLGYRTLIINPQWVDAGPFSGYEKVIVARDEPWAANTLSFGDKIMIPAGNPKSRLMIEARGFRVEEIEIRELQKAEAGLTCLSLIFNAARPDQDLR